jgi:putative ABC transport system permease protein
VGLMQKKLQNSNYNGQRDERCAFIPWTTFAALYGVKYVSNIMFRPLDLSRSKDVTNDIKRHLSKLIGFDPADPDAIFVWDTMELERQFTVFFLAFTIFLGVIGSFTLLVGGVGVASIMRVVVEERTREIMLLGGLVGFGLSAGALQAVKAFPSSGFTDFVGVPALNPLVIVSTILILLVIGVVAGMIPARTAASTDPITALRK